MAYKLHSSLPLYSINSLKLGFHYLLPVLDERGRAIIYNDITLLPLEADQGGVMTSNEVCVSLHMN